MDNTVFDTVQEYVAFMNERLHACKTIREKLNLQAVITLSYLWNDGKDYKWHWAMPSSTNYHMLATSHEFRTLIRRKLNHLSINNMKLAIKDGAQVNAFFTFNKANVKRQVQYASSNKLRKAK